MSIKYTETQGRYLAYIYYYTKINGIAPSHADITAYFGVTPPTVNSMLKTLSDRALLTREPNVARSLKVTLAPNELPLIW